MRAPQRSHKPVAADRAGREGTSQRSGAQKKMKTKGNRCVPQVCQASAFLQRMLRVVGTGELFWGAKLEVGHVFALCVVPTLRAAIGRPASVCLSVVTAALDPAVSCVHVCSLRATQHCVSTGVPR